MRRERMDTPVPLMELQIDDADIRDNSIPMNNAPVASQSFNSTRNNNHLNVLYFNSTDPCRTPGHRQQYIQNLETAGFNARPGNNQLNIRNLDVAGFNAKAATDQLNICNFNAAGFKPRTVNHQLNTRNVNATRVFHSLPMNHQLPTLCFAAERFKAGTDKHQPSVERFSEHIGSSHPLFYTREFTSTADNNLLNLKSFSRCKSRLATKENTLVDNSISTLDANSTIDNNLLSRSVSDSSECMAQFYEDIDLQNIDAFIPHESEGEPTALNLMMMK